MILDSLKSESIRQRVELATRPLSSSGPIHHIVYHRRPIPNEDRDHRVTSVDRMEFNDDGTIKPVIMTFEGVDARPIR